MTLSHSRPLQTSVYAEIDVLLLCALSMWSVYRGCTHQTVQWCYRFQLFIAHIRVAIFYSHSAPPIGRRWTRVNSVNMNSQSTWTPFLTLFCVSLSTFLFDTFCSCRCCCCVFLHSVVAVVVVVFILRVSVSFNLANKPKPNKPMPISYAIAIHGEMLIVSNLCADLAIGHGKNFWSLELRVCSLDRTIDVRWSIVRSHFSRAVNYR